MTAYLSLLLKGQTELLGAGLKTLFFMRWFFLSLILVYGWLGSDAATIQYWWQPDTAGLVSACYQITVISLFVLIVNLLIRLTQRNELIEGLYCLTIPFSYVGMDPRRFILRIILVLQHLDASLLSLKLMRKTIVSCNWLDQVVDAGVKSYQETVSHVDDQPCRQLSIDLTFPQWWQWLLPLFLGLVVISL